MPRNLYSVVSAKANYRESYTSVTVDVDAVQDLNGYDAPWVGGAGKNLCSTDTYVIPENSNSNKVWEGSLSGTFTVSVDKSKITSVAYQSASIMTVYVDGVATQCSYSDGEITVTGTLQRIFIYGSNAYARAVGTLGIQIELGSTATAWTPYENICPITGWTGAEVITCGKNIFDPEEAVEGYFIDNSTGATIPRADSVASGYISVVPEATYMISPTLSSGNWGAWYDADKNFISGFTGYAASKTAPSNATYLRITCSYNGSNPDWETTCQVELGSTATTYEPYQGTTLTYSFGQTVYGAKLNALTGEVTVTHAIVDMGTLEWALANQTDNIFRASISDMAIPSSRNAPGIISSALVISSSTGLDDSMTDYGMLRNTSSHHLYVRATNYSDAATFTSAMSGVQLVYELSTPTTISTSAQSITPQEYIWADTGDVTVEYGLSDLGLYSVVTVEDPFS